MGKKATVRQVQCAMLLCAEGYMPSGASALTGNFSQESGPTLPTAFRKSHLDHGSNGLAQWRLKRLDDYQAFVCRTVDPNGEMSADELWDEYGRLDLQVKYVALELQNDYPSLNYKLRKGGSVSALTADICWQYERPNKYAANLANRISNALIVFESIPTGATQAHHTNIVAAMDQQADAHDKQKHAGLASVAAGTGLAALTGVSHFAHALHWWEWAILGVVTFMVVTGILAAIVNSKQAALIRNAKPNVDTEAPKLVPPPEVPMPKAAQLEANRPKRKSAHQAEEDAINAAMGKPKPEDEAHAEAEAKVAAEEKKP